MKIEGNELALLRACLANDDEFLEKFRSWEQTADLDSLNYGAVRLLPYLKIRVDQHSLQTDLKPKLDGIYRYFWAKRQVQGAAIDKHLVPFLNGKPAIALKGLSLEGLAYRLPELRPFDDVDILVSRVHYFELAELAGDFGLDYAGPGPEQSTVYLRHAKTYRAKNIELDLHWTTIPVAADPQFELRMFERSQEWPQGPRGFRNPSPTDCLLHTILHGNRGNSVSPIRWYLDAFLLIQRNSIDWPLFWREAELIGLNRQVKKAAARLNDLVEHQIIDLKNAPSSKRITGLSRIASLASYGATSLWAGRLLRLLGSDVPIVNKALAMDAKIHAGLRPHYWAALESIYEINTVLRNNSLKSVIRGTWFK